MSMTDPISDMLTRIRNAILAGHRSVAFPASTMKERICKILQEEGYIESYETDRTVPHRATTSVQLKWNSTASAIEGLRRVSRPGQRTYVPCGDIPRVRNGLGIMIVSTSRGVMTDRAARRAGVGGELICSVW